ncbi:hypothetical protein [Amycolatopsis methanolica]|uniref:Alcohol dehydrogenase n=1 Tax=Amycolatopsis methanolica 239 TaxID=1068978 RepID=A0A076MYV5_AMYME|nr:hypothetical protein [Amycolatopsis methanolica]AIJ23890.1 alcohol dehydrogenase [Amycolatopsis methanolica 239]
MHCLPERASRDRPRGVAAIDRNTSRAAGAPRFVLSHPEPAKDVRALTGGRGADAFEGVGAAALIRLAWAAAPRDGSCTVGGGRRRQVTGGRLDLAPLVTHRTGLKTFERMAAGQGAQSRIDLDAR